jgi:hypothetical protein
MAKAYVLRKAQEGGDFSKPHLNIFPVQIDEDGFVPSFYMTYPRDDGSNFPKESVCKGLIVDFDAWIENRKERSTQFYGLGEDYKWIHIYLHNNTLIK